MKKLYFTITILSILASLVYGCSSTASTPEQSTTTNVPVVTTTVAPVPNTTFSAPTEQIVNAGSSLVVPTNGVYVQAGRHLNLNWGANNN